VPVHAATVPRSSRIARDAVGIGNRLHDLRHFYASGLSRAGCDVVTVQRTLGHSSAAITLTTYSHLWPDANDRTRRAAADPLRTESKI
jgi:integrase